MDLYFSEHFEVAPAILRKYGAFDICVVSDLPLFIDPFLLFNSKKPAYRKLHHEIIKYLVFLRDKSEIGLDPGLIQAWYRFKEVRQNWLGFTLLGNDGHALGAVFAEALHQSLGTILKDFGDEQVTKGTHLEKLCLIRGGVGRDSISDFTTNLIKDYLLRYTERFARGHLDSAYCQNFAVARARFNYKTESWETKSYYLPRLGTDYVLLTPSDILTRDETWINYPDMLGKFSSLPDALPNEELRAQVNQYFRSLLSAKSTESERRFAAQATIARFPVLIDEYIKLQEDQGDLAESLASAKVADTHRVFIQQVQHVVTDLEAKTDFFHQPWTSFEEAIERVKGFKAYVEDQDGYKLINRAGKPFSREEDVQLFFGLIWFNSEFDVNREVNNGRGPVDFKVSRGKRDKSLIEFKLASNTGLERNLQKQVAIYEAANQTRKSVKVIICYSEADQKKVTRVLTDLKLVNEPSIVVIDARNDNKPSASKA